MGFPFLIACSAPSALRYAIPAVSLSPLSRAEQSLKAEHHICDLCVSLRGSKASQVFYLL